MDETSLSVAYLNEEIASLDDAQERSHQDVWYQDEDSWADETAVARRADEVQERDPWTDIDNGADEWEESAADCTNAWVDIDCGDEYQGDEGRSEETDVAGLYDEAQEGSYQEAMDRLLGNEPASYSDEYSYRTRVMKEHLLGSKLKRPSVNAKPAWPPKPPSANAVQPNANAWPGWLPRG